MREPVRRELALVLGDGQVMVNAQVGDDIVPAHELLRLRGKGLALVKHDFDLAADCHQRQQRNLDGALKLSREDRQLRSFGL